jgi:transcriptional regulator with XRE-family HTH domain
MKNSRPYSAFGKTLAELRKKAGIQQADLAKQIKATQQTVSRWEMGNSRPRDKQMPIIAAVLSADINELLTAAGYHPPQMRVTPFVQPFPIDALSPENFERFCLYFLERLYKNKEAVVHLAGESGHTQDGIDIEATFPNKAVYSFQCKRVQQFGPKDVHTAVAKHIRKSKKKFLLLSRVASPQARDAITNHAAWDIWDKEDISREIRQNLPKDEQLKLVDIFFSGQRFALLGETEAGPWQEPKDFFAPFMAAASAFSHRWSLIGRDPETEDVVTALSDATKHAVFLVGAGGSGKSRVLKEAIEKYQAEHNTVLVRFLSPRHEIKAKNLEDLGAVEKLIIVDDAHDESGLQLLFQYVAGSGNTKLLLAFRPYGRDFIKVQAGNFALTGDSIAEISLKPLDLSQSTELAAQVLKAFNGPVDAAEQIARFTRDCPLATVIGAQIVAKGSVNQLELTKNEAQFRDTIFARFQDVIAGAIGHNGDDESIRKLLKVIALVQPFHPEDRSIANLVENVEGVSSHDANRLISLLANAGVLFKRGGKYRLSPDLLADFVIEQHCIGINLTSTGYAEKVFEAAGDAHVKNVLLNLSKLDWRLTDRQPTNSKLLDGIWEKLRPSQEYADPYLEAVSSVAYYQPERALRFVEQLMAESRYLAELPTIINYAAYNFEHLPDACALLWELGKDDKRDLGQHTGHAIRILAELCGVERNKPFGYNEVVVDFALNLIDEGDAWNHYYTPFDILKSILAAEGSFTESRGISFSFGNFAINYSFVAPLRERTIAAALRLLSSPSPKIAVLAARFLGEAVRYYSMTGSETHHKSWNKAITKTLKDIEQVILDETLDPLVRVELTRSVSWHAKYANNRTTTPIAKRIIALQPTSSHYRTTLALIDGYGHLRERDDLERSMNEWHAAVEALAKELVDTYPDGKQLHTFITEILAHIFANFGSGSSAPYILLQHLINSSQVFSEAILADALDTHQSKTILFADIALAKLLSEEHTKAIVIATRFLETSVRELHFAVASGYGRYGWAGAAFGANDLALLQKVVASEDEWVVRSTGQAIRSVAKQDQRAAIELLKCIDFRIPGKVADEALLLFQRQEVIPFSTLTENDIDFFLEKLMEVQELDGYWTETFLANCSKHHAQKTALFFMKRVERAAKAQNWRYRPCNHGPYCHVPLRFRESPDFGVILRQVAQWMRVHGNDYLFTSRAAELFETMFRPFDGELLGFLQDWIDTAGAEDIDIISRILREASGDVVFAHRQFVLRFLEKAKQYGKERLDNARSSLYAAASTGMRSGTLGQPFPQDIRLKELAEKALNETPRYSPAYRLYEWLKKGAEQDIERSLKERELYEE